MIVSLEPLSSMTVVSRPSVCRFCWFIVPRSVAIILGIVWGILVAVAYAAGFGCGGGWCSCGSSLPSVFPPLY